MHCTAPTVIAQDGSHRNVLKTLDKHRHSLLNLLIRVKDGRSDQGKRHELNLILIILFLGILKGFTTVKECRAYAAEPRIMRFLKPYVDLKFGIPAESTISYAIQLMDVSDLVLAANSFLALVHGYDIEQDEESASFDGKTMCGVSGEDMIRHILSIFTHKHHQTIGQMGVTAKENEIPAMRRLLKEINFKGLTLVGDALHGQKDTAAAIIAAQCQYLLFIKGNQGEFEETLAMNFADSNLKSESYTDCQNKRGRHIETRVTISQDVDLKAFEKQGWTGIAWIGQVQRTGYHTIKGVKKEINEVVYFISSQKNLTAEKACEMVRNHWKIENNLHWQKDVTYQEDKQRLRLGRGPQVMTFLRSLCIGLFKLMGYESVADTLLGFKTNIERHLRFVQVAGVV